ncbi:hypothetical protein EVAR_68202_1 [Eumeta japonica]|uniref:Uncharacterized protein n=1 Tax=Eumeta variegata TaxID=151549 RepID=A0A4C2A682_EUMVA|nr:hypothetical protein EVAR_68202_1 [Eumeta japonica]
MTPSGASVAAAALTEYEGNHYLVVVDTQAKRIGVSTMTTNATNIISDFGNGLHVLDYRYMSDEAKNVVSSLGVQIEQETVHESYKMHSLVPAPTTQALVEAETPKEIIEE